MVYPLEAIVETTPAKGKLVINGSKRLSPTFVVTFKLKAFEKASVQFGFVTLVRIKYVPFINAIVAVAPVAPTISE